MDLPFLRTDRKYRKVLRQLRKRKACGKRPLDLPFLRTGRKHRKVLQQLRTAQSLRRDRGGNDYGTAGNKLHLPELRRTDAF